MKTTTLLNRALFAIALIAASTAAFANGGGSGPRGAHHASYPYADSRSGWVASVVTPLAVSTQKSGAPRANDLVSQGKTRAEVYQELLDAKKSGEFARTEVAYRGH